MGTASTTAAWIGAATGVVAFGWHVVDRLTEPAEQAAQQTTIEVEARELAETFSQNTELISISDSERHMLGLRERTISKADELRTRGLTLFNDAPDRLITATFRPNQAGFRQDLAIGILSVRISEIATDCTEFAAVEWQRDIDLADRAQRVRDVASAGDTAIAEQLRLMQLVSDGDEIAEDLPSWQLPRQCSEVAPLTDRAADTTAQHQTIGIDANELHATFIRNGRLMANSDSEQYVLDLRARMMRQADELRSLGLAAFNDAPTRLSASMLETSASNLERDVAIGVLAVRLSNLATRCTEFAAFTWLNESDANERVTSVSSVISAANEALMIELDLLDSALDGEVSADLPPWSTPERCQL